MPLSIAIQADPIERLNIKSDSTLRLAHEALARGHTVHTYTPDSLSLQGTRVTAHTRTLHLNEALAATLGEPQKTDLASVDVVLVRQDPPYDMNYLTATYMLELLPAEVLVANRPAALRNHPEKISPALFPEFTPATLISRHLPDIEAFRREVGAVVIKPLYGFGGRSVFHLSAGDMNANALLELLLGEHPEPLVVQRFLPEVASTDCRIVLMNGKLAGAFGRIPASGDVRANMRVGGTPVKIELSKRQHEIIEAVAPMLKKTGIFFAGLDTIGEYLTEINITSPTGLAALENLYGSNPAALFWDEVETAITPRLLNR